MNCRLVFAFIFFAGLPFHIHAQPKKKPYGNVLWYTSPAVNFNEALPIGNGRLGAMVFGGITTDQFVLNEETLWSGAPSESNNPDARKYLPLVRAAALAGEYKKADSLIRFMQGPYTESYMPMADLSLQYELPGKIESYQRSLYLDSAITSTRFQIGNVLYNRESFVSFPDQLFVYRLTSTGKARISFTLGLSSRLHYTVTVVSENHIVLRGKAPKHVDPQYLWRIPDSVAVQYASSQGGEGMNFEVHLMVLHTGGKIHIDGNRIILEQADAATVCVSGATSFNGYDHSPGMDGKDPSLKAVRDLRAADVYSFEQLKKRHLQDYQPIYQRVSIHLGKTTQADLPTDTRLKNMSEETDPELVATVFQYGRYLLIASSRPGGQPANLKGIWNDKVRPEYSSNWAIDHDAQMFYYPVETTGLTEMHLPFLQLIAELAENGKKTAAINYGMHGWVSHHNTDIWRISAPVGNWGQGNPPWANFNMSAAWLCGHLYDHYLFTGDKNFLRKAWPVMKGAAEFCVDWLSYDQDSNILIVPSVSPENSFVTAAGDTCDVSVNSTVYIALIKELFKNCVRTADFLQTDKGFAEKLLRLADKLPAYRIGSRGQLLEWNTEWESFDPTHRHLSHLYPVFPGTEINPVDEPILADAAKKALNERKKTNSSWGFAWKAGCWARLGEGDSAWSSLANQLRYVDPLNKNKKYNIGLYPNLFNSEIPSIIMNGNACATAVITEMIMQSNEKEIMLLPAIPNVFSTGAVQGLRARGGFEVDCNWAGRRLVKGKIISRLGNQCRIIIEQPIRIFCNKKEIKTRREQNGAYSFRTVAGAIYHLVAV